jgi:hypothetical protein
MVAMSGEALFDAGFAIARPIRRGGPMYTAVTLDQGPAQPESPIRGTVTLHAYVSALVNSQQTEGPNS